MTYNTLRRSLPTPPGLTGGSRSQLARREQKWIARLNRATSIEREHGTRIKIPDSRLRDFRDDWLLGGAVLCSQTAIAI